MDNGNNERVEELVNEEETEINEQFGAENTAEPVTVGPKTVEMEESVTSATEQDEPAYQAAAASQPDQSVKESRRERKAREKEQARFEKEMAKQKAREEKAAAREAKKAERRYRNIPAVIIMSLIIALLVASLGYLGWEYVGRLSMIDGLNDEKSRLTAELEELGETLKDKEAQISDQLSQIENKNALISDSDAAAKEFSEKVTALEDKLQAVRDEAGEILDVVSNKGPLGVAYSGDFYADRSVILIENGESFPLNVSVMYGEKKTAISYSFDEATKNIDTLSLSQESITGRSGLISVKARKKTAEESGIAVLKFENEHSEDYFYVIVIVK